MIGQGGLLFVTPGARKGAPVKGVKIKGVSEDSTVTWQPKQGETIRKCLMKVNEFMFVWYVWLMKEIMLILLQPLIRTLSLTHVIRWHRDSNMILIAGNPSHTGRVRCWGSRLVNCPMTLARNTRYYLSPTHLLQTKRICLISLFLVF